MQNKRSLRSSQILSTVVSRFSGLRFSGLSRFSGLFLLLVWQQKWSNHTIGMILFSGLLLFNGRFAVMDYSTKLRHHCIHFCKTRKEIYFYSAHHTYVIIIQHIIKGKMLYSQLHCAYTKACQGRQFYNILLIWVVYYYVQYC